MSELPSQPVSPSEFFEHYLPRAFEELVLPDDVIDLELALGVQLEGEGGGQWRFAFSEGGLEVSSGSREDTLVSLVQSVEDWRGTLWEGRGGAIGRRAAEMIRSGRPPLPATPSGLPDTPNQQMLDQIRGLDGVIEVTVFDDEEPDWRLCVKLGPGPLPDEATTTVRIASADVAALDSGELDPLQAFMSGRIEVGGDITLVLQLQAIAMQAAMSPREW